MLSHAEREMTRVRPEVFLCVKQAAGLEGPARFNADASDVAPECRRWSTNDPDRLALDAALRARDCGRIGSITCVTAGPVAADEALYYCLAAGADRAVRIPVAAAALFEPAVAGALLAAAIHHLGGRLVFTAQRSSDGESGMVPVYLAHALGAAYLSNASDFQLDGATVEIRRRIEGGHRQVWRSQLPAVVAFDGGGACPRYVAVAAMALARRREVQQLAPPALGVSLPQLPRPLRFERLVPPRVRTKRLPGPDWNQSAPERLRTIVSGGSARTESTILEGPRDEVAAVAADYLLKRRLLRRRDP